MTLLEALSIRGELPYDADEEVRHFLKLPVLYPTPNWPIVEEPVHVHDYFVS